LYQQFGGVYSWPCYPLWTTRNVLARLGASTSTNIVFLLSRAESNSLHFSVSNSSSHVLFSLGDGDNTIHLLSIGSDNAFLLFGTGISSSIDGSSIPFLFFLASSGDIPLFFLCSLGRILCLGRGSFDVVAEALGFLPVFRSEGFEIIDESVELMRKSLRTLNLEYRSKIGLSDTDFRRSSKDMALPRMPSP
jgi:hypothetical protein